jgi:hypothetical protein
LNAEIIPTKSSDCQSNHDVVTVSGIPLRNQRKKRFRSPEWRDNRDAKSLACADDGTHLEGEYNENMARGWESKSIEAQQEQASQKTTGSRAKMTAAEAVVFREKENLRLSRHNIVRQLESASNPRHRKLLEETLAALEEKLAGM